MSRALKPVFWSLATVKLVVNVGEHQNETNGITRFPCNSMAFLLDILLSNIIESDASYFVFLLKWLFCIGSPGTSTETIIA